jgi:hypothetical protein
MNAARDGIAPANKRAKVCNTVAKWANVVFAQQSAMQSRVQFRMEFGLSFVPFSATLGKWEIQHGSSTIAQKSWLQPFGDYRPDA